MPLNVSETPFKEFIDIALTLGLVYGVLAWLRHTKARLALIGAATLGSAYLLARLAGLALTAWALQGFVALAAVLLVVIFQADLRRGLERTALPVVGRPRRPAPAEAQQALVRAVIGLASARHGALVVLQGWEPVDRHVEGGVPLGGLLSEPLLLSLFDPCSAGHDGAVLIEGGLVRRFGVQLPLSSDFEQLGTRGTRHAAALGLAERCDALTIVVSEERGSICLAHDGRLAEAGTPAVVERAIGEFASASRTSPTPPGVWPRLRRNGRDLLVATAISLVCWAAVVPGSEMTETVVPVRVVVQDLPPGYVLDKVDPEDVTVTASGPRRTLLLAGPDDFEVDVDAILVQLGRHGFDVHTGEVKRPPGVTVLAVQPAHVSLSVRASAASAPPAAAAAGPATPGT